MTRMQVEQVLGPHIGRKFAASCRSMCGWTIEWFCEFNLDELVAPLALRCWIPSQYDAGRHLSCPVHALTVGAARRNTCFALGEMESD